MNIFSVLSMGKASLREESMSAMLAYLLNPSQDHGLGDKFLNVFLELANKNNMYNDIINKGGFPQNKYKFQIDLEVQYNYKSKRNDIDIQIKVYDKCYKELHRILIENKIKSSASNEIQLSNYHEAVLNDKNNDDPLESNTKLSIIFLTPHVSKLGLKKEYDNLKIDNKVWIYWNSNIEELTVTRLIQNILKEEQLANISPINEYLRHTLKAFTYFLNNTINIQNNKNRVGEDIGEEKDRRNISIDGKSYTILLRESGQVQLLDENGDKVKAREKLVSYLITNNIIEIDDKKKNTRQLGKMIFDMKEENEN